MLCFFSMKRHAEQVLSEVLTGSLIVPTMKTEKIRREKQMNKTLIAYFSATHTTEHLAKKLANVVQGDLFEIVPVKRYTEEDLNWNDENSRSSIEMKDPACRPAIASTLNNMEEYDTVFVGFPIWWYEAPRIIETFLESYDFSGKTLVPFATSGGSGMGKTVDELRKLCPNADWKAGKMMSGVSDQALAAWAAEFS